MLQKIVQQVSWIKEKCYPLWGRLRKAITLSKLAIILIVCSWWISVGQYDTFQRNHIMNDVISYYAYLPATLVYHDITLKFVDSNPSFFGNKIWPIPGPNGSRFIKTSMGLSVMYAPFFWVGHKLAPHFGYPADGYSQPYQAAIIFGVFVYLLIGFIFLRKLLRMFFSEWVTFITLISLFLGTNLFYYSVVTPMMAHSFLFALCSVFLYFAVVFLDAPTWKRAVWLGLLAGLMTLIRPTMILILLFPTLYKVYNRVSLKDKLSFVKDNWGKVLIAVVCFFLPLIPQLIYWKYVTGHWVFFSYVGERFFFDNPHISEGFFSYRKGWLTYTPIMIFSMLGMVALARYFKSTFLAVFVPFVLFAYVLLSWWTWWYGGSFGQRVFIDLYPLLALPFGAFFHFLLRRHIRFQDLAYFIAVILIFFNIFQTWEFNEGLIHYSSMTSESYWRSILQTKGSTQYWLSLKAPNDYAAMRGIHEKYVGVEGFEQETIPVESQKQLDYTRHQEGKSSFVLNESCPYTPALTMNVGDLIDQRGQGLRISAYVWMPETYPQEDHEKAYLIASMEGPDGKMVNYQGANLFDKCAKGKWCEVKYDLGYSEEFRKNRIKVYLSNQGKEKIWVDNLKIEIR